MNSVENFYKVLKKYNSERAALVFVNYIYKFIAYCVMFIPVSTIIKDKEFKTLILFYLFFIISEYFYLLPFTAVRYHGQWIKVRERLKYIPADRKCIRQYCFKQVDKYCLRVFIIGQLIQLIMNIVAKENILMGIAAVFVTSLILEILGRLMVKNV